MSDNCLSQIQKLSIYDEMETEQLETILRRDALGECCIDQKCLLYIMEVLAQRRSQTVSADSTPRQAWESFKQNYYPVDKSRSIPIPPKLRPFAAAAAAAVLLIGIPLGVGAYTRSLKPQIQMSWTDERFTLTCQKDAKFPPAGDGPGAQYSSLEDMLLRNNQDVNVLPTWIPERFRLSDLKMYDDGKHLFFTAEYTDGEDMMFVCLDTLADGTTIYETEDGVHEQYTHEGTHYYILKNLGQYGAVWVNEPYQCNVYGDLSLSELKSILNSIQKG